MINVILVDDHQVFVQGLEALLSRSDDINVLNSFNNGLDLMRFLADGILPNVLFLDIEMGQPNGVEVAEMVLQQYPSVKVIMLSTYFSDDFVSKLLESGISGYLLKSTGFTELKDAIRNVANGSFSFSSEVMEVIVGGYKASSSNGDSNKTEHSSSQLTEREIELIKLIGEELTMKEIADKIYLSEHTVKTHRKNIMAKLDVKNTAGMIKKAFILGLIE